MNIFKKFFNWIKNISLSKVESEHTNWSPITQFPSVDELDKMNTLSIARIHNQSRCPDSEIDKIADSIKPLSVAMKESIKNILEPGRELLGDVFYKSDFRNDYKLSLETLAKKSLHFELSSPYDKSYISVRETCLPDVDYSLDFFDRVSYKLNDTKNNAYAQCNVKPCDTKPCDTVPCDATSCEKDVKISNKKVLQLKLKNKKKGKKKK